MTRKVRSYEAEELVVEFDVKRCIHAEECIHGLPEVFDATNRPWIDASKAAPEDLMRTIERCPTGALHYRRTDGVEEQPKATNTVRIEADGPLYVTGLAAGGFFLTRATRHDQRGRILRRLMRRIGELNISDNSAYRACKDESLRTLLRAFHGDWPRRPCADDYDTLRGIRIAAEDVYPDEVFPHFDRIVFDSAETFTAIVDRFLQDDAARRPLADEMRRIVVERFSYRARMDEFLRAMGTYLAEISRCPT